MSSFEDRQLRTFELLKSFSTTVIDEPPVAVPAPRPAPGRHRAVNYQGFRWFTPVPVAASKRQRDAGADFRHRAFVVALTIACVGVLWLLQDYVWPGSPRLHGTLAAVWTGSGLLWLAPLPASVFNLVGLLCYKPSRNRHAAAPIQQLVSWRIVSRGTNTDALSATIERCREEMRAAPLFPYIIEVVTDVVNPLLPRGPDIVHIVVPDTYQTSNGSRFKARALQFALEHSALPDDAWIVHLTKRPAPCAPASLE